MSTVDLERREKELRMELLRSLIRTQRALGELAQGMADYQKAVIRGLPGVRPPRRRIGRPGRLWLSARVSALRKRPLPSNVIDEVRAKSPHS